MELTITDKDDIKQFKNYVGAFKTLRSMELIGREVDGRLRMKTLDPAGTTYFELYLTDGETLDLDIDNEEAFAIDPEDLYDALTSLYPCDGLTVEVTETDIEMSDHDDNPTTIHIPQLVFDRAEQSLYGTSDAAEQSVESFADGHSIILSATAGSFNSLVRAARTFDSEAVIRFYRDGSSFIADSIEDEKKVSKHIEEEHVQQVGSDPEFRAMYDAKRLAQATKPLGGDQDLTIKMDTDEPLYVETESEDGAYTAKIALAPRIEE